MKPCVAKSITLSLLFMLFFCGAALAEIRPGAYTVSLMGGGYSFDETQQLESSPFYSLAVGHNLGQSFTLELAGQQVPTTSKAINNDYNLWIGRVDLLYHLNPESRFVVHFLAGGGILSIEDTDGNSPSDTDGLFNYGLGMQFFLSDSTALRLDGRHILTAENSSTGGGIENFSYSAGLTFHMGGGDATPRTVDSDRDGIIDSLDVCPNTPAGARVDNQGCTADSDGDGVLDIDDQCPDTPGNTPVLRNGCPSDSDNDGVIDAEDQCPDTPPNTEIDGNGCPVEIQQVTGFESIAVADSDMDGVGDDTDLCPGTPAETQVDSSGCPLTDDTVADALSLDIQFATGTSKVDARSQKQLAGASAFLKRYPGSKIRIEGHTDSTGSDGYNLRLSQQRAESVRALLIRDYGVNPNQVIAKGYGELKPIAPNNTPEGRQANRRVVISILR